MSRINETILKIEKWLYSITQEIKIEYVTMVLGVSAVFFKNRHPEIAIAEINVIIGLSITKILNIIRKIVYKIDWTLVILKGYFFELLNIEKANNPLIRYLIVSVTKRSKENHYLIFKNSLNIL